MSGFAGRVAVITGASRGIGAGMALEMARHDVRLALCARSQPALPDSEGVLSERLDVADEAALEAFACRSIERFGRIDLWINNAGVLDPIQPLRDVALDDFREHLRVNLEGVFLGSRCFVRHLRERGGEGVLVNVSSGAARRPYHGWSAYCAGKAAVDRLTECIALEEQGTGLRALSLAPGVVDTDMQEKIRASSAEDFAEVERFRQRTDWNSAGYVAREILALAFDPARRSDEVLVSLDPEPS
ncbi:MAG: SDR family NAD(P)-dependent oxidoreductase [Myxococcota bacterium]|nr:SDR family NAD(P)-dependent oxidoreductase [Myxococcota bacterium]